ncbi:MAG: hypothetical protein LBF82_00895 [Lactobacillales bacterium]|jgi:hypothetical protein|nr:hypothetical protein [Lactobacillales bacterium]
MDYFPNCSISCKSQDCRHFGFFQRNHQYDPNLQYTPELTVEKIQSYNNCIMDTLNPGKSTPSQKQYYFKYLGKPLYEAITKGNIQAKEDRMVSSFYRKENGMLFFDFGSLRILSGKEDIQQIIESVKNDDGFNPDEKQALFEEWFNSNRCIIKVYHAPESILGEWQALEALAQLLEASEKLKSDSSKKEEYIEALLRFKFFANKTSTFVRGQATLFLSFERAITQNAGYKIEETNEWDKNNGGVCSDVAGLITLKEEDFIEVNKNNLRLTTIQ